MSRLNLNNLFGTLYDDRSRRVSNLVGNTQPSGAAGQASSFAAAQASQRAQQQAAQQAAQQQAQQLQQQLAQQAAQAQAAQQQAQQQQLAEQQYNLQKSQFELQRARDFTPQVSVSPGTGSQQLRSSRTGFGNAINDYMDVALGRAPVSSSPGPLGAINLFTTAGYNQTGRLQPGPSVNRNDAFLGGNYPGDNIRGTVSSHFTR